MSKIMKYSQINKWLNQKKGPNNIHKEAFWYLQLRSASCQPFQ